MAKARTTPTDALPRLAAALDAARAEAGLSVYALGSRSGVAKQMLGKLLAGRTPKPSAETVAKLLAALGKPWAWLDEI